jgi:L-serine dehydratase
MALGMMLPGLISGFMGMELTDPRVGKSVQLAKEANLDVQFNVLDYGAVHPNNYRMQVTAASGVTHLWEAISVGGGMIEMQKIDGYSINICGGYFELLIFTTKKEAAEIKKSVQKLIPQIEYMTESESGEGLLFVVKTVKAVDETVVKSLKEAKDVFCVISLDPVLPTKSRADCKVPFSSATELLEYAKTSNRGMWQMATLYESMRGGTTEEEAYQKMYELTGIELNAVKEGLKGTEYKDRILGPQAYLMDLQKKKNPLFPGDLISNVIRNITAIMEVKSSFGVIIAAPTAG